MVRGETGVLKRCGWTIQCPGVLFLLAGLAVFACRLVTGKWSPTGAHSPRVAGVGVTAVTLWGAAAIVLGHQIRRGSLRAAVFFTVISWPWFVCGVFVGISGLLGYGESMCGGCWAVLLTGFLVMNGHEAISACRRLRQEARRARTLPEGVEAQEL